MPSQSRYAQVVNPQINPNLTKRNGWSSIANAVGSTDKLASSTYTKKTSTTGKGKKKKTTTTYNYPYKVTAHKFGFNLPKNAYIKKITVGVRMKTSKNGTGSVFPSCGFYIKDKKSSIFDTAVSGETGWHNGVYWVHPKKKLSTSLYTYKYVMDETNYSYGGFSIDHLNSDYFGVDLNFAHSYDPQTVYLKWVWVTIDYDVPTYTLVHDGADTTYSNPRQLSTGVESSVTFTLSQSSKASDSEHQYRIDVPWGVEILGIDFGSSNLFTRCFVANTDNKNIKNWIVQFTGSGSAWVKIRFMDYTHNVDTIGVRLKEETIPSGYAYEGSRYKQFTFESKRGWVNDYNTINIARISPDTPHLRHQSCFAVTTKNVSGDNHLSYFIKDNKDFDLVPFKDDNDNDLPIQLDDLTSGSVSILSTNLNNFTRNRDGTYEIPADIQIEVEFTVPDNNTPFDIGFTICLRPKSQDKNTLTVTSESGVSNFLPFDVADPYEYHIGATANDSDAEQHERIIGERINFINHRIASNLETGAFVLPCRVKDGDAIMVQDKPHIHMYKWEQIDYIGCVPLEHLHFDPKSTYKDKLLDTHYKNKRYMGKQLASDEDITLNVRLHPRQVTTIQGLIDMDKPIPINANHLIWEGDSLNHRGWAEIYGITTTLTNPHWYKCDIDVKYLTHNLNTRFHIEQGDKTFGKYSIPSLLAEINSSGDSLSENSNNDFFIIDTDGTYAYDDDHGKWEVFLDMDGDEVIWTEATTELVDVDEDGVQHTYTGEEVLIHLEDLGLNYETPVLNQPIKIYEEYITDATLKNRFTLDEGQHLSIKSRNPLSTVNQIIFNWSSSKLSEVKENRISRIIRLIDESTGDIVFEYEYCDFDFEGYKQYTSDVDESTTGILNCRVIGRRKNKEDYDSVIDSIITLATNVETEEAVTDNYDEDTKTYISDLKYFGSSLHFQLNNNVLAVVDEGYNGKELTRENIELEGNRYYWESYWVNKNTDGEDADIVSFIDIVVQDSVLESKYADKYGSMYVSPFPVQDKKVIFTRNAEEGVLYYLEDNEEEFTYLIEPYYQYHNGVDLRASVDDNTGDYISIFNLNYGYRVIYLENGLVSLGINRLNGKMYLRRYDPVLEEYITLFNLHLNKYDDININSISDDRIELQASDTTIIMYRGHPYVIFKHELEDIGIDTKSYKVWGQKVDGNESNYPAYFDLMNHDNLLPMCVTGKLDDDCVSLEEHTIPDSSLTDTDIELANVLGDVYVNDTITLHTNLKGTETPFTGKVCYLVRKDNETGYDEVGCSSDGTFDYKVDEQGAYHFIAVYTGDDTHKYCITNEISVTVGVPPEIVEPETVVPPETPTPTPQVVGNYKLTMSTPSKTLSYRDGTVITFTLTYGGKPVQGKVIEMIDFGYVNTATTNAQGQVHITNNREKNYPQKWKIGARFWNGGNKVVAQVFKDITVKYTPTEIVLRNGAVRKGGSFSVKLKNKVTGKGLANKKVTVTINGKTYNRTTNEYGNIFVKVTEKGTMKYKVVFGGGIVYSKSSFSYREKVK